MVIYPSIIFDAVCVFLDPEYHLEAVDGEVQTRDAIRKYVLPYVDQWGEQSKVNLRNTLVYSIIRSQDDPVYLHDLDMRSWYHTDVPFPLPENSVLFYIWLLDEIFHMEASPTFLTDDIVFDYNHLADCRL